MLKDSRYQYCYELFDDDGVPYLTEPEPFEYRDEPDNRVYTAVDGDTLWGLAHFAFAGYPRPCGMWWIIGQYQPTPIIDPTIAITAGTKIYIPSERVVRLMLFNPERRRLH